MNKSEIIIQKIHFLYEAKKLSNKERLQFYIDYIKSQIGLTVKIHMRFNKLSKRFGKTFFHIESDDTESDIQKLESGFLNDTIIKDVQSGGANAIAIFVKPIKDHDEVNKLLGR